MADRMELRVCTDPSLEHVVIELWQNQTPLGHIFLSPSDTEKHIGDLGRHRAALKDPVVPTLDPGSRIEAIADPAWRIPDYRLPQGRPLALRHPGLGWLSFVLPDKEAASIAEWLTKDLPIKDPPKT